MIREDSENPGSGWGSDDEEDKQLYDYNPAENCGTKKVPLPPNTPFLGNFQGLHH